MIGPGYLLKCPALPLLVSRPRDLGPMIRKRNLPLWGQPLPHNQYLLNSFRRYHNMAVTLGQRPLLISISSRAPLSSTAVLPDHFALAHQVQGVSGEHSMMQPQ